MRLEEKKVKKKSPLLRKIPKCTASDERITQPHIRKRKKVAPSSRKYLLSASRACLKCTFPLLLFFVLCKYVNKRVWTMETIADKTDEGREITHAYYLIDSLNDKQEMKNINNIIKSK